MINHDLWPLPRSLVSIRTNKFDDTSMTMNIIIIMNGLHGIIIGVLHSMRFDIFLLFHEIDVRPESEQKSVFRRK